MTAADYAWPEHTAATLLAGLAATRDADQAERFARLLPPCPNPRRCLTASHDHGGDS